MAHSLENKHRTKDVILDDNVSFDSLYLHQNILQGLKDSGYRKPSPIQIKAIPIGRCGFDLIVKSKSGTGKTLVFSIIALESLKLENTASQVLVLAPAREIAVQIQDVFKCIGKHCDGLKVESFIGGLPVSTDKQKCHACHIAVGTPGRIKQLIKQKHLNTASISLLILDEADKLMESSFQNDINEIYNALPNKKQLIMASATYPDELSKFLSNYMLSPTQITSENDNPLLLGLKHFVNIVKCHPNVVQQTKIKNEELLKILSHISFSQCLIFSNYQTRAESLSNMLKQNNWSATFISAAQPQKQRLEAINDLKEFKCRVLLSTDLTARGIDASNVDLVINYDIPFEAVTYMHRMGRAGRYGSSGICINLPSEGAELKLLQTLLGTIGGTNMSIPKLPSLTKNLDLYSFEISDPDQYIFGCLPDENTIGSEKLKNEILQLKKQAKEQKKIESNIEGTSAVIKKVLQEETNIVSCTKDSDSISLLKMLADGNNSVSFIDKEANSLEEFKDIDTKSLLESLASSGTVDIPETPKSTLQVDTKNNATDHDKIRKIPPNASVISSPSSFTTDNVSDNMENNVYCKNLALFNVAKIISNCGDVKSSAESLDKYFEVLKQEEKSVQLESTDLFKNLKFSTIEESVENQDLAEDSYLENIFLKSYKSFVDLDNSDWKSFVPKAALDLFQKQLLNPNMCIDEEDYEEECDEDLEEYYEEDYNMQEDDIREVECNNQDNGVESDCSYSFMKWVPVEKSENKISKIDTSHQQACLENTSGEVIDKYEGFQEYYNECSQTLWQTGLCFENVPDFDNWFHYDWQAQLSAVRNYVQQNVYVQEMSQFQQQQKVKRYKTSKS